MFLGDLSCSLSSLLSLLPGSLFPATCDLCPIPVRPHSQSIPITFSYSLLLFLPFLCVLIFILSLQYTKDVIWHKRHLTLHHLRHIFLRALLIDITRLPAWLNQFQHEGDPSYLEQCLRLPFHGKRGSRDYEPR